ncbi:hypothetical protein Patl1_00786 [Pistacia atlantica]|uniref:Uncharacterized protein n=1 Tax=Pistacia atlantica TaxID=434234 RepID=A0ACC1C5S8_9ROSI|nr:hypothetical protein Patl1_00786 [Pistacia atlantica]
MGLRLGFEAWNFCNEVGEEAPGMGSPRAADCFDLSTKVTKYRKHKISTQSSSLEHKVSEAVNKLGVGTSFPGLKPIDVNNTDLYAAEKEKYLGSLCEVEDTPSPWQFWMVMLKNGNYDTTSGSFRGTYDLGADFSGGLDGISFYEVAWEKKVGAGGWAFRHKLKTSKKYPWLMLYLRADATQGFSGGYHYDTRGMLKTVLKCEPAMFTNPDFKLGVTLKMGQG